MNPRQAHQLPASREESNGVSSEPNLDVFSAIFCSDHDVLTEVGGENLDRVAVFGTSTVGRNFAQRCFFGQVVKLPGGSKARLMCDKHPAGPLNVPDPANYKDTKVA